MPSEMRGYNGNLSLTDDGVRIDRGLKGLLVRKQRPALVEIPRKELREVWFQPSTGQWGLPGYVLLVGPDAAPDSYVARVRANRAVTFLGHGEDWRRFAQTVASECKVPFHEFPPEARSGSKVARDWFRVIGRRRS